jgi:putative transcriptional regulator
LRTAPQGHAGIRRRAGVSQGVFASYLNVPSSLVSRWERGKRRPTGAAVKLLSLVKRKGLDAIA